MRSLSREERLAGERESVAHRGRAAGQIPDPKFQNAHANAGIAISLQICRMALRLACGEKESIEIVPQIRRVAKPDSKFHVSAARCPLPTAFNLFPTFPGQHSHMPDFQFPRPAAHCRLPTADCLLPTAHCFRLVPHVRARPGTRPAESARRPRRPSALSSP